MATVSNDFSRFRIVNLHDDRPGRGPFVVTQRGSNPGDPALAEHEYVLGRNGEWVEWTEVLAGGEQGFEEVVFDTIEEVIVAVEGLKGGAAVRVPSRSADEVLAQLERLQANGGIREEIRRLLVARHERKSAR